MKNSLRALLAGTIDYAGLFPPASLSLGETVRNYLSYRTQPEAWMLARFTDSGRGQVANARRALGCGELRELLEATSGPLGFTDILRNIAWAPRLTSLRVSPAPPLAEKELCGGEP